MKTPLWESSPGALGTLLNNLRSGPPGSTATKAHLYTFNLAGGGQLTFTDADLDISVPGFGATYWSSKGVRVDVGSTPALGHWKRGLDVDTWIVVLSPRPTDPITGDPFPDKIGSVPFVQAAGQGALDGADVTVDRAYFASWPQPWTQAVQPVGVIRMFAGWPAEVDIGDITVSITLRDYRQKLLKNLPLGVFQAGCPHTLYDAGCTLIQASFGVATAIGAGSTRASITSTAVPPGGSSGTFTLGRITMTSGLNSGFKRTVSLWGPGVFNLQNPLPFDVAPGDTFTAYPGCDKTQATCTLFGNVANFAGESFIPAAETAI